MTLNLTPKPDLRVKKHRSDHEIDRPPSRKPVRFELIHATARSISIIGSFNGWRHDATPMSRVGADRWFQVLLLPPGTYEYQFLVDGKWMPDPQARKTTPNQFGEVNSILKVTG
jgi:1,4-alpha-glucan branching enzyme